LPDVQGARVIGDHVRALRRFYSIGRGAAASTRLRKVEKMGKLKASCICMAAFDALPMSAWEQRKVCSECCFRLANSMILPLSAAPVALINKVTSLHDDCRPQNRSFA